jgi:hypothetical protein
MRPLHKLFEIMIDEKNMNQYFSFGLCGYANTLFCFNLITIEEKKAIREYILNNPPKGQLSSLNDYYWRVGDKAPRIKYLKHHINKLNPKANGYRDWYKRLCSFFKRWKTKNI